MLHLGRVQGSAIHTITARREIVSSVPKQVFVQALFLTRFMTHYCAPVFAFLGELERGKSIQQVSWFFLTRGLWLVFLELTVLDFAWGFVPWAHAGVMWGLGWSMVAMALIAYPPWIAGSRQSGAQAESYFAGL